MDGPSDPLLFLAMVAFISLSGALMPGPMFATVVSRGLADGRAGLKRSVGHAIIMVLTAANPYFILWWATVGASLVVLASGFGLVIMPLFVAVHLTCDFGWLHFVSFTVHRSRTLWTGNRYRLLYGACGALLIVFALYFIYSSLATFVG